MRCNRAVHFNCWFSRFHFGFLAHNNSFVRTLASSRRTTQALAIQERSRVVYEPRPIESTPDWQDPDGIKVYTISASGQVVDQAPYFSRLAAVKKQRSVAWPSTPAFAVFHDGASMAYLVLAWWGNGNELFTAVSVLTPSGWVEDSAKYSFCLYDLEVMWHERNYFIQCMCGATPSLKRYRTMRFRRG